MFNSMFRAVRFPKWKVKNVEIEDSVIKLQEEFEVKIKLQEYRIQTELRQLKDNFSKLESLINYLERNHLPQLGNTIANLEALLEQAQSHRKGSLISRTIGVSVGGTSVLLGLVSIPAAFLTLGATLPLSITSLGLAAGGGTTSIVTNLVDSSLTNGDLKALKKIVESTLTIPQYFPQLMKGFDDWDGTKEKFPRLWQYFETWREIQLSSFQDGDKKVTKKDLKGGDHVFRSVSFNSSVFHHGICAKKFGRMGVIDFGQKSGTHGREIKWKPVEQFLEESDRILYRRNYILALPVKETLEFARQAEEGILLGFSYEYNLLLNNCEHFATFCKLGKAHCDQWIRWAGVGKMTATAMQKAGVAMKGTGTAIKVAQVTGSVANVVGKTAMVAGAIVGPVALAIDIALLVSEYKRERSNISNVEAALISFKNMEKSLKIILVELQGALDVLIQRMDYSVINSYGS